MCDRAQLARRGCRRSVWLKPGVQRRKLGKTRLECASCPHTTCQQSSRKPGIILNGSLTLHNQTDTTFGPVQVLSIS